MSNHPYRQKMVQNEAPYPVLELGSKDSLAEEISSLRKTNNSQEEVKLEYYSPRLTVGVAVNSKEPVSMKTADVSDTSMYTLGEASSKSLPYPVYGAGTPPPLFPQTSEIASPMSNPLSTTSSITNFNLVPAGVGAGDPTNFSKSENNITAALNQSEIAQHGHNRSVSSTSSFFYDRSDNLSMIDFSQNLIHQYLGDNSEHLLPRIKTIELYRKNAKKSNDPNVLFQYAQYMLQTALLLDTDSTPSTSTSPQNGSLNNSPKVKAFDKSLRASSVSLISKKNAKNNALDDASNSETEMVDHKLKRSLLKEAIVYLKKLSDKGYVDAQYLLADAYSSGALDKVDNRYAFQLFQAAAKHGHVESAYRTSYCYENGLGTGRDARKAMDFLKMAASKNHPAAMYKLGIYSFYGRMGLSQSMNTKKAGIKWLTRASNVANELIAAAPYELGKIYFDGFKDIVIADKKYALELYAQAAALGHVEAAALLGKFYEFGEIVPQDSNLSIHYYTQAALGGHPESMLAMCAWYLVGSDLCLEKDETEAFEWAKRAANCDLMKAQFALANFYDKGIGCIKNPNEAQYWYKKAAENGDPKSLARIKDKVEAAKIEKRMKKHGIKLPLNDSNVQAVEKECVIM